jgi:8-oxo-dGTP pyrophosphatase MutT (NUDIX family)
MIKVFAGNKMVIFGNYQPTHEESVQTFTESDINSELPEKIMNTNHPIWLCTEITWQSAFVKFKNLFHEIPAAGGVVFNADDQVLMIHRLGHWDLPKGKIDDGETKEQAAVREVCEETNLKHVEIKEPLPSTHHIYFHKNKWIIKETFWFKMVTNDSTPLIPQVEEGIDQVLWVSRQDALARLNESYASIKDLLKNIL